MKCSVKGCNFEGERKDFIMMTSEIEIAGKIEKVKLPICYGCNSKYSPDAFSVSCKGNSERC